MSDDLKICAARSAKTFNGDDVMCEPIVRHISDDVIKFIEHSDLTISKIQNMIKPADSFTGFGIGELVKFQHIHPLVNKIRPDFIMENTTQAIIDELKFNSRYFGKFDKTCLAEFDPFISNHRLFIVSTPESIRTIGESAMSDVFDAKFNHIHFNKICMQTPKITMIKDRKGTKYDND